MKKKWYLILTLILFCVIGIYYYATFPAINIHIESFWMVVFVICILLGVIFAAQNIGKKVKQQNKVTFTEIRQFPLLSKFFLVLGVVVIAVFILGSIAGSTFFRAKSYASLLEVKKYEFSKDIEESEQITDIALMDTDSARKFGNRKIGSLSDVVSQYEVETDYTQISIDKTPMKVSCLKYASFFKWFNNRDKGVPGYVKVNPVNSNAEYVAVKEGMKYVPSAYFNYNLQRHVQLKYPTKIIAGYHFETDDEGNPYYICPTVTARIGLFGGMDVNGVIICNPVNGDCEYYKTDNIPSWVDSAYSGRLLTQKYDWHGTLSGGFWNSIIGQKGCKQTTDDFGYKIIEDDVWIYTGVTSVTGDQSNIGFIMMNQRTSEAKYYSVSGAEEHSAMDSAEGAVQEKGYKASFPSLINVSGTPTYIMVLKDAAGLVKMYAMVNVEQYNIVATATSQTEVMKKYKQMLNKKGVSSEEKESQTSQIVVEDINFIDTEDGTMVYIKDTSHIVYKQLFEENEELIKISKGDTLSVTYDPMDNGIQLMTAFEILPK
ncbi:MAG: hypothetical protein SO170_00680 [Butyribacter sp.]|nr:hypothetical protein [bacterium]MDY3853464.1 hypothetical protein [Butyribacter sp.]